MATTSILAAGVFFPIVTKNIDMSVGSMMGLLGGICALSQLKWGFGVVGSIAFVVVIGILLGIFQDTDRVCGYPGFHCYAGRISGMERRAISDYGKQSGISY